MANQTGQTDQALITGRIAYGYDGTNARPIKVGTDSKLIPAQREPFICRPAAAALANGMVASGTRSGGTTVTAGSAAVEWGTEYVYEPLRAGKIDGISSGGVVNGQITVGLASVAATSDAKVTARIRNKDGTWTTVLALTGTIACTTAEIYRTYDIPYLKTTANFNAIPFGIAIGVQSNLAAATGSVARMMESSFIEGEFEPGT